MNDEIKKAWELFLKSVKKSSEAQKLIKKISSGSVSYQEAQKYSSLLSELLVNSTSEVFPNDSEQVLNALRNTQFCQNYFRQVDSYLNDVQKAINIENDINLNPVKPIVPKQLLDQSVRSSDDYISDIRNFANKVELSSNKHVDTYQQKNAKFQSDAGYGVTVSRTYDGRGLSDGRTCKFCMERVGSKIPYPQAVKKGMFQRHEGCHCVIEYNNNGKKTYQSGKGGQKSFYKVEEKKRNKTLEFEHKRRVAKLNHEHYDATEEWLYNANNHKGIAKEHDEITVNGKTYKYDGKNVLLDHNKTEKAIAKMIATKTGKDVLILPRVVEPKNIKCADYMIDGEKWDLKTLENNTTKHNVYNAIHKKKDQARCFIINIEISGMTLENTIDQVLNDVFRSDRTYFVEKMMIVNEKEILKVFEK